MDEEARFSYRELRERLEGEIGERVILQLAERRYGMGATARVTNLERGVILHGIPGAVAYFAISDFLDLCFGQLISDLGER